MKHLKTAIGLPSGTTKGTSDVVQTMLERIADKGEAAVREYAQRLDNWSGPVRLDDQAIALAKHEISDELRAAIDYAHANIHAFATAQRATCTDFEIALRPGLIAGQKQIPLSSAGCYVPGGRYAHIASALMTITTARAAGVAQVTACSPPREGQGIAPAIIYAMDLAGADTILALGGVQGVAAMANGLFGCKRADILVGPGNQFVAEAKRQLFGPTGIDMVAGPTDSLVIADKTADPLTVAWDLIGQAEHGSNSPVWLVTDDVALARQVMALVPACIAELPTVNRNSAEVAWDALGEVMLCKDRDEMATTANDYAPEHLHVQATDLEWWKENLTAYGSLFLGENSTVAFGDKAAGPNHVLPTSGAARYTGGLSVHKFIKTVTWQTAAPAAIPDLARATATISRFEGMEGHARTAELRLSKHASEV